MLLSVEEISLSSRRQELLAGWVLATGRDGVGREEVVCFFLRGAGRARFSSIPGAKQELARCLL